MWLVVGRPFWTWVTILGEARTGSGLLIGVGSEWAKVSWRRATLRLLTWRRYESSVENIHLSDLMKAVWSLRLRAIRKRWVSMSIHFWPRIKKTIFLCLIVWNCCFSAWENSAVCHEVVGCHCLEIITIAGPQWLADSEAISEPFCFCEQAYFKQRIWTGQNSLHSPFSLKISVRHRLLPKKSSELKVNISKESRKDTQGRRTKVARPLTY